MSSGSATMALARSERHFGRVGIGRRAEAHRRARPRFDLRSLVRVSGPCRVAAAGLRRRGRARNLTLGGCVARASERGWRADGRGQPDCG